MRTGSRSSRSPRQHHDQHGAVDPQRAPLLRSVRARGHGRAHPGQDRRLKEEGHLDGRGRAARISRREPGPPHRRGACRSRSQALRDYLQRGAVSALNKQLHQNDILVPERIDGAGRRCGGKPFSRGHLYTILSNPIYVGRLSHKGHVHDGQHPAIVDQTTWDGVQAQLASNLQGHRRARLASEHLLIGRIRDDRGHAMTPTHAQKGSRRYRYYVSQAVLQGRARGAISRVPANEIEVLVLEALRGRASADGDLTDRDLVANYLRQVTIHKDRIEITLHEESEGAI